MKTIIDTDNYDPLVARKQKTLPSGITFSARLVLDVSLDGKPYSPMPPNSKKAIKSDMDTALAQLIGQITQHKL